MAHLRSPRDGYPPAVGTPDDSLDALRSELLRLELALAQRRPEALPAGGYEAVLHPAFHEVGASGRAWTREATLDALDGAPAVDVPIERFRVELLGPGIALATFDTGGDRPARRVSVWVRDGGRWRVRFHQGSTL